MIIKIGELEKGTIFIKNDIWYKKLNERVTNYNIHVNEYSSGVSQYGVFTIFKNNLEVETRNEQPKDIFIRERINR